MTTQRLAAALAWERRARQRGPDTRDAHRMRRTLVRQKTSVDLRRRAARYRWRARVGRDARDARCVDVRDQGRPRVRCRKALRGGPGFVDATGCAEREYTCGLSLFREGASREATLVGFEGGHRRYAVVSSDGASGCAKQRNLLHERETLFESGRIASLGRNRTALDRRIAWRRARRAPRQCIGESANFDRTDGLCRRFERLRGTIDCGWRSLHDSAS